jgi:hypothetical protein
VIDIILWTPIVLAIVIAVLFFIGAAFDRVLNYFSEPAPVVAESERTSFSGEIIGALIKELPKALAKKLAKGDHRTEPKSESTSEVSSFPPTEGGVR